MCIGLLVGRWWQRIGVASKENRASRLEVGDSLPLLPKGFSISFMLTWIVVATSLVAEFIADGASSL
jgi:hypothetical protein